MIRLSAGSYLVQLIATNVNARFTPTVYLSAERHDQGEASEARSVCLPTISYAHHPSADGQASSRSCGTQLAYPVNADTRYM